VIHIQPGKPICHERVENFNCRPRDECLTVSLRSVMDARTKITTTMTNGPTAVWVTGRPNEAAEARKSSAIVG
jgi:hypothetical protein